MSAEESTDGAIPSEDDTSAEDPPAPVLGAGGAIVAVETAPPGARVLIGGEAAGETPLEWDDVRAGAHVVVLDHPDHEPVELPGQQFAEGRVLRIERVLVAATGSLTVRTQPRGAWVERDGVRLAESTPVTLDGLPAGAVELALGADAHHTAIMTAEVPRDGLGSLEWTLEPIPHGTLTIKVDPPDAVVTLPDIGPAYEPGMSLLEGEYRVEVSHEGYRPVARAVVVGGATRERIELEPNPQPFTVSATPAGAAIDLVGLAEPYSPGMLLAPGDYRVRASLAGFAPWEAVVPHRDGPTRIEVELVWVWGAGRGVRRRAVVGRGRPGDGDDSCRKVPHGLRVWPGLR